MKRIIILFIAFAIIVSAGCTERQTGNENTAVISYSRTIQPSASIISTSSDETLAITDGPLPGLLGNKWYDFDKVGAYPGASMVQCGDRIAFPKIEYGEGELDYDCYLSFSDPDGSNCVETNIKNSYDPNYWDGWVYFIYDGDCIYKIKTDGSRLTMVFKAQSSIRGTTEIRLKNLLIVETKYMFLRISSTTTI